VQQAIMSHEAARNLAWERFGRADDVGPKTRALFAEGAAVTAATYDEALAAAAAARSAVLELFGDLDAVLVPSAPGEAPASLESTGDAAFNRPWTLLHLPCVTLPGAQGPNGLPVGVQLVGRPRDDARLLAVALFAETALGRAA
jgi:Asp-tRNA(Asn)/Glu-tRNA(Gln) amidotransferase A subunit family amidase